MTDPTVNELQRMAAEMFGKEAALFVPSGTMGNLVSIGAHSPRGGEMIVGRLNHIFKYEGGGASSALGVAFHTLPNEPDGTLSLQNIAAAIRDTDDHYPKTTLVCVENTHNGCGGVPLTAEYMDSLGEFCHSRDIPLHVDGARLMNAAVAEGVPAARLLEAADSASICLSKGLGAPIGSIVVGSEPFIREARRLRKRLGGGMRQAGVIAACGIVALRDNVHDLERDHRLAKSMARGLSATDGIVLDPKSIRTNIIYFGVDESVGSQRLVDELGEYGFFIGTYGTDKCRAVVHRQVPDDTADRFVDVVAEIMPRLQEEAAKKKANVVGE